MIREAVNSLKKQSYNYNSQTGMYRNKILIQRRVIMTDARKQELSTYEDFGSYFAMVKTQKSDEILIGGAEKNKVMDRFIIKYSKRLDELIKEVGTSIRIVYNSNFYDVTSCINDNGLNETLTILGEREDRENG